MHAWLILPLACFGVALAATLLALRGRRVDDHPHCRRCGFDLFGKPAESVRCSECGADLARRRAVRVGRRERHGRVVAVAVPLLAVASAWSGWAGWREARVVDWNRVKPAWWLARQAEGRDPAARDAALNELARRIEAGRMSAARVDGLVARALELQADRSRTWVPAWGTVVEAAHDARRLTDEQWQRYMVQALTLVLDPAPSPVRRIDALAIRLSAGVDRVGALTATRGPRVQAQRIGVYGVLPITIDGRAVDVKLGLGFVSRRLDISTPPPELPADAVAGLPNAVPLLSAVTYAGPGRPTTMPSHETMFRIGLTPPEWLGGGEHTAKLKLYLVPLTIARDATGRSIDVPAGPARSVVLEVPWTLLNAARVNTDPARRAAVERALSIGQVTFQASGGRYGLISGFLRCQAPPIPLAYNIYILSGDYEYRAGTALFAPGGFSTAARFGAYFVPADPPPATVEIELRPEPALVPAGVTEVWGGTVTIKDVPVNVLAPTPPRLPR